jgi:diguanylate cyclase (GGDEF)-like protein
LYEQIEQLAIKDGLTNLYLKRYFLDRMSEEIARQLRHKTQLSFLMIDLDKFKEYNDRFGHVAGDIVLKTMGFILTDFFKSPGDLVCRYGGEEFSVLLPDCSKLKALELAEQLRGRIEKQPILLRRQKTHITISAGIATFPKDAQSKEELISKADQALYKAKQSGRNSIFSA